MSYAVVHMQKIKMGGVRGIQNHNERLIESHTNPDIDYSKSHKNKSLDEQPDDKTYYNRIRDRIKELDLPKAVRKDAVTMCGFICTSDKAFFEKMPQEQQDRFFQESYNFLKERYGEKNIVAATVHYDETTPHMHYYMVPVTPDGRLSAKDIFTRAELKQLQTEYHRHMVSKGFDLERGVSSERKHLSVQEFKLETKKQEIAKTKAELEKLQEIDTSVKVKIEKGALGYSTKDVEELKKLAEAQRFENFEMQQAIQKQENKIVGLENALKTAQKKAEGIETLQSELNTLKNENMALQEYLDETPEAVKALEKHVSFQKQVHNEGEALAELKKKYAAISAYEVKNHANMRATKTEYDKVKASIKDLCQRKDQIEKLGSEITQLQDQRQEIGKISLKNALKGSERNALDDSIEKLTTSLNQAVDDLKDRYNITPGQIDEMIKQLQRRAEELISENKGQQIDAEKLHQAKIKILDDYKYYDVKTSLYSEANRGIVTEKFKSVKIDTVAQRELNTLTQTDIQKINERLPDGLKDKFKKYIDERVKTARDIGLTR